MNDVQEKLLTIANNIPINELQDFYDDLDFISTSLAGEVISLNWVAGEILAVSRERGAPIQDWHAPAPHGTGGKGKLTA